MIAERTIEKQRDLYLCFIDYEKAFDRVKHTHLMHMLENIGIDQNDLNIIRKLYWSQKECVKVNGEMTEFQEIKRGVCFVTRPLLLIWRNDNEKYKGL